MTVEGYPRTRAQQSIGIVAFGETKRLVEWDSPEWVYWTMNDGYAFFAKKVSAVFEMHPPSHYTDPKQYRPDHEARLAAMRVPVYLAFPNPKIPNGTPYPLDAVLKRFTRRYFCSTIAYMIPFAIMTIEDSIRKQDGLYLPRIGLWGCDMQLSTDYARERACVEYWLKEAEAAGIELVIPDESPLLKAGYDYGYEWETVGNTERIINARTDQLNDMLEDARRADREAHEHVLSLEGMVREAGFYKSHLTKTR